MMVNTLGVPEQPFASGLTEIVAVIGDDVLFVAVKEGISPVPFAANPIAVLLLVHVNVLALTEPLKLIADVKEFLHSTWLTG